MMNTITDNLNQVKKFLRAFEWKPAEQKSDVVLVVKEIDKIRREVIEPLIDTSEVLDKVNSDLALFTLQSLQILSDETLNGFHASLVFAQIREPSYESIIVMIDTYIHHHPNKEGRAY